MNPRERMAVATRLGEADRVPVMCQLAIGHYFLHSGTPKLDVWFRSEGFAEALVRMQQRYGFDGILVNLPGRDPDYEKHIDRLEEKSDETWVHWKNGCYTVVPHDDNPHYFQPDGSRYFPTFDQVDPDCLWYVEPWDFTDITYPYSWSFETGPRACDDFFPDYHAETIRAVRKRVGQEVAVHSEIFSPFSQFLELLNYEDALVAMMDDPGKTHACLARLTEGAIDLADRQARLGVDAVLISSAFAGGAFLSRDHYREWVLPYEKQIIREVQARHTGLPIYTHTCGAIGDRLDLMIETGTNGIDTLDPPPLGTVELEEAVPQLKGKAFIKGNIDPVNTLLLGNREKVEQAVRQRLRVAAPGGGYILSTACSVAPRTDPALIEWMAQLAHELGTYH